MKRTLAHRAWLILAVVVVVRTIAFALLGPAPFDDTYITFRYALNLAEGHGLVYNLDEQVLGTTAPAWAVILGAARLVGLPIETAALAIAAIADVASAVLIARLMRLTGSSRAVAAAAAVLFLSFADYLTLSRSGMESAFFVFLTLAAIVAMLEKRVYVMAVVAPLAFLTRPEGVALWLAIVVLLMWCTRSKSTRSRAVGSLLFVATTTGVWVAYAQSIYGSFIPNSITAKASGQARMREASDYNLLRFFFEGQGPSDSYLQATWLQLNAVITLFAAIGAYLLLREVVRNWRRAWVPAAVLLAWPAVFLVAYASAGAFTFFPWYFAPLYPFMAMLAIKGAEGVARALSDRIPLGRDAFPVALATILAIAQVLATTLVKMPADERNDWVRGLAQSVDQVPADPNVTVSALEVGSVGWSRYPVHIDDLQGLVSPGGVPENRMAHILDRRPDYVSFRSSDAAAVGLLQRVKQGDEFARSYVLAEAVPDIKGDATYCLYAHRDRLPADAVPSTQQRSGTSAC